MEALIQQISEGKELARLKVQDLATAAGIGKGTIYEYFKSKEEILERAVFYSLDKELQVLEAMLYKDLDFEAVLSEIIEYLSHKLKERRLVYEMLAQSHNRDVEFCILEEHKAIMEGFIQRMMALQNCIIHRGKKQGMIDPQCDDAFCRYVIMAAMGSIIKGHIIDEEDSLEMAKRMLKRSIGTQEWRMV